MKRQHKPLPSYFELCTLKLYLQKNGFALGNLSQKKTEKVCPSVKPRGEGGQRGPTRQKINSQSLEDTQVRYISQKYTLDITHFGKIHLKNT